MILMFSPMQSQAYIAPISIGQPNGMIVGIPIGVDRQNMVNLDKLSISELKQLRDNIDREIKDRASMKPEDKAKKERDIMEASLALLGMLLLLPISIIILEKFGGYR